MKQRILKTIYNFGGFRPFHNLNRRKILILMYHRFSRTPDPFKISEKEFEAHLEYLQRRTTVVSLDEILSAENPDDLPPNPTVITIDDGYRDAYDIAFPLLKKYRMPATLYVVTEFVAGGIWLWTDFTRYLLDASGAEFFSYEHPNGEKFEAELNSSADRFEAAGRLNSILKKLPEKEKNFRIGEIARSLEMQIPTEPTEDFAAISWEQAREMDADLVKIESHTATHPILPNVGGKRLAFELVEAKKKLETVLGRKIRHFCYPNGSLNEKVRAAVEEAGYASAVTTEYGFNAETADSFLLKRIDAQPDIAKFAQSVSGFEFFRQKISL